MQITELIRKKREGGEHTAGELEWLLKGYLYGEVKDYQMAAWLMAVYFRGMTTEETSVWTGLMWKSGASFPRRDRNDYWIDKHSTGGVGDKTSLILVPLVTAVCRELLGRHRVKIPMVSGRGLGHSGGTLDKLESVPGFSPAISVDEGMELLSKNGFFMMGQTEDLAPADRLIYALRDVTATVESRPLIVSSILSKKLSESLDGLVLDVKVGDGAFMKTLSEATALAEALVGTARAQGVEAVALFTRMDEPLGFTAGNHFEVAECADFLEGKRRERGLREVTLALAARMVSLASGKRIPPGEAMAASEAMLETPEPILLFREMFRAQGGDWEAFEKERATLKSTLREFVLRAPASGWVAGVQARPIGCLLNALGGGRASMEKAIDPWVGIEFPRKVGEGVKAGEPVVVVYYRNAGEEEIIERFLHGIVTVRNGTPPAAASWVLGQSS